MKNIIPRAALVALAWTAARQKYAAQVDGQKRFRQAAMLPHRPAAKTEDALNARDTGWVLWRR
jgi:hypothetical protein